jgi:hypothetical protein
LFVNFLFNSYGFSRIGLYGMINNFIPQNHWGQLGSNGVRSHCLWLLLMMANCVDSGGSHCGGGGNGIGQCKANCGGMKKLRTWLGVEQNGRGMENWRKQIGAIAIRGGGGECRLLVIWMN